MREGGLGAQAQQRLEHQLQQARAKQDTATVARVLIALSDLARIQADMRKAGRYLAQAWQQATDLTALPKDILAELYFQRANLRALRDKGQYAQAQADYQQALEYAINPILRARIQANLARLWATVCGDNGADMACDAAQAQTDAQAAWQAGDSLIGAEKTEHQLHLMLTALALSARHPRIIELAQSWMFAPDPTAWSTRQRFFLYYYQSQLRQHGDDVDSARLLAQQAYFTAQEDQGQDVLYLGAYRLGRLWFARFHQTQNSEDRNKAIFYLTQALDAWEIIMPQWLRTGFGAEYTHNAVRRDFRATPEGELYYLLAEALLRDNADETALRKTAIVLEQFKKTALVDYYRDDCLTLANSKNCAQPNALLQEELADAPDDFCTMQSNDSALLYPIVFDDRVELIWWRGTQAGRRISVPLARASLQHQIQQWLEQLRNPLAKQDDVGRLTLAQALYDVLLRPLAADLQDVRTLVIIPDSALLQIPFSALHDGQQYVVERYALAVQLYRQQKQATPPAEPRILLAGLPPAKLPLAEQEIHQIARLYAPNNIHLLSGEHYARAILQKNLQQHIYDIVHIASHAQYQPEARDSVLQTVDGNIQLEELQRWLRQAYYRGHPADLVVLSACQTAHGEDRSILGLAGSALEAQVHSVAASLWKVDDLATCVLMSSFHTYLRQGVGKAQALRQAQLDLLHGTVAAHPCSELAQTTDFSPPQAWAGFILIGNP